MFSSEYMSICMILLLLKKLCIVFELLKENLYQILKVNHLQGLSFSSIHYLLKQILEEILQFHKFNLVHCDL